MTSLLSAISGHFNRALIFGTLVPVITFVLVAGWLVESWLPWTAPWHRLASWGAEWQAGVGFLVIALMTGLLQSINVPLTRMYEGYPWERTLIGRWRVARYQKKYDALDARWRGYRTLRYAVEDDAVLAKAGGNDVQREALAWEHARIGRELAESFPRRSSILPTRLGNAIRAFENYPQNQYGMSGILLWPRLVAVIGTEYASGIEEQKSSFDFMVNCSALAFFTAATLVGLGLAVPMPFASPV